MPGNAEEAEVGPFRKAPEGEGTVRCLHSKAQPVDYRKRTLHADGSIGFKQGADASSWADLYRFFCKKGVPGCSLIILCTKLLIDSQDHVCLHHTSAVFIVMRES